MIVVDTNVMVHLILQTAEYASARALLDADANWYAPYLWRSEFRNTLALHMRHANRSLDDAVAAVRLAEEQMYGHEFFVDPVAVLDLVATSTCSAYDCEFIALAR